MVRHLSGVSQFTAQIDAVRQGLPEGGEGSAAVVPDLSQKLGDAAQYLSSARNDIQLNVQPPISVAHTTAVEQLVKSVISLVLIPAVMASLGRSLTNNDLADNGYKLLGQAGRYKALAAHYFSTNVKRARDARPSNEVSDEVDKVSDRAEEFKTAIIDYIDEVRSEFIRARTGNTGSMT